MLGKVDKIISNENQIYQTHRCLRATNHLKNQILRATSANAISSFVDCLFLHHIYSNTDFILIS